MRPPLDAREDDLVLGILEEGRNRPREIGGARPPRVEPGHLDPACEPPAVEVRNEPGQRAQQRRLPRAGRPEQRDDLARLDLERDVPQRRSRTSGTLNDRPRTVARATAAPIATHSGGSDERRPIPPRQPSAARASPPAARSRGPPSPRRDSAPARASRPATATAGGRGRAGPRPPPRARATPRRDPPRPAPASARASSRARPRAPTGAQPAPTAQPVVVEQQRVGRERQRDRRQPQPLEEPVLQLLARHVELPEHRHVGPVQSGCEPIVSTNGVTRTTAIAEADRTDQVEPPPARGSAEAHDEQQRPRSPPPRRCDERARPQPPARRAAQLRQPASRHPVAEAERATSGAASRGRP